MRDSCSSDYVEDFFHAAEVVHVRARYVFRGKCLELCEGLFLLIFVLFVVSRY